uniref:Uncharacterized protein n=1 Tax=Arundo donax TaxID=35708 RepID=A0A0A8XUY9_ARUDO
MELIVKEMMDISCCLVQNLYYAQYIMTLIMHKARFKGECILKIAPYRPEGNKPRHAKTNRNPGPAEIDQFVAAQNAPPPPPEMPIPAPVPSSQWVASTGFFTPMFDQLQQGISQGIQQGFHDFRQQFQLQYKQDFSGFEQDFSASPLLLRMCSSSSLLL